MKKNKIGIIGVGIVTMDFAQRAAFCGYKVLLSHTKTQSILKEKTNRISDNIKIVSINEAAAAPIIIMFLPFEELEFSIMQLPDMSDKIILHTNNPIFDIETSLPSIEAKSSSQLVSSLLPAAHIVRVFNPLIVKGIKENKKIYYRADNYKVEKEVKYFLETLQFSAVNLEKEEIAYVRRDANGDSSIL